MSKIAILTDSTANLSPQMLQAHAIHVVPLRIIWDDQSYLDGIAISPTEFYTRLATSPMLPTTSQPSVHDFLQAYETLATDHDAVVAPLISSGISGTVGSALIAARQFQRIPVYVVDTHSTSAAQTLIVLAAARAAAQGRSVEDIVRLAKTMAKNMKTYFMVETLKYLHMGGRIGGASRYLGAALSIKPILYFNAAGEIDALERVRTHRKAMERLFELAATHAGQAPVRVGVIHAQAPEQAAAVRQKMEQHLNCQEIMTLELSPVIGVHVGPGTVGIAIYAE